MLLEQGLFVRCLALSEKSLLLPNSVCQFNRLVLQVQDVEFPVNDLLLAIERPFDGRLQCKLRLLHLLLANREQGHLLVHFLDADALPESFTLEVFNDCVPLALLIRHELIDVGEADRACLLLWSFDLFPLGVDDVLPGILAHHQRRVKCAPVNVSSLLLCGFDLPAPAGLLPAR